jgi:phosphoglycolate phosphatase-like HAD superfamily hydrolase
VRIVLQKHNIHLPVVVARDCSEPKPHPSAAETALARLGITAEPAHRPHIWMVGDGEFDIQLAHAAGLTGIWLSLGRQRDFSDAPHATLESLYDLLTLLRLTA